MKRRVLSRKALACLSDLFYGPKTPVGKELKRESAQRRSPAKLSTAQQRTIDALRSPGSYVRDRGASYYELFSAVEPFWKCRKRLPWRTLDVLIRRGLVIHETRIINSTQYVGWWLSDSANASSPDRQTKPEESAND